MGEREWVESTSSIVLSTSIDWFEAWRTLVGRVMVRTLVMGAAADFSLMADMIAVCRCDGYGMRWLCGSVIDSSRLLRDCVARDANVQERGGESLQLISWRSLIRLGSQLS